MASLIASDDDNTQFVGAHDPDGRLAVRFYTKVLPNEFESKKQDRPIFYEADFVTIWIPGNQLSNFDGFVNDTHKKRFPKQWARYVNNKSESNAGQISGTPVEEWPLISRAQAEELKALKFFTVESIAGCSDAQLQSIGMKAGMQPHAFRERAQRFINLASESSKVNAQAEENRALKEANERNESALNELRRQLEQMQQSKPGRKPKVKEAA